MDAVAHLRLPRGGVAALHRSCNRAVIEGLGFSGIAAEIEDHVGRPAAVFDAELMLLGHGPRFAVRVGQPVLRALRDGGVPGAWKPDANPDGGAATDTCCADSLSEVVLRETTSEVFALGQISGHGLGRGWAMRAVARHRVLGFACLLDDPADTSLAPIGLEEAVLGVAADATAIEIMRNQGSQLLLAMARGEVLRKLLMGTAAARDEDLARTLGLSSTAQYHLVVADETAPADAIDDLRRRLRVVGRDTLDCEVDRVSVIVVEMNVGAGPVRAVIESVIARYDDGVVRWAMGQGTRPLCEIHELYAQARRALRVARSVAPRCGLADPEDLGPYMILGALGDDVDASAPALALIAPLISYDEKTGRNLLETLETFLEEKGNTSSSARRLFLNRHSLMYRLRRIEQLTGRSLDAADDRFLLDLSVKLHRLSLPGGGEISQPTGRRFVAA